MDFQTVAADEIVPLSESPKLIKKPVVYEPPWMVS